MQKRPCTIRRAAITRWQSSRRLTVLSPQNRNARRLHRYQSSPPHLHASSNHACLNTPISIVRKRRKPTLCLRFSKVVADSNYSFSPCSLQQYWVTANWCELAATSGICRLTGGMSGFLGHSSAIKEDRAIRSRLSGAYSRSRWRRFCEFAKRKQPDVHSLGEYPWFRQHS